MAHPLEQRVDLVRRKAASMLRWIAMCRVVTAMLAALLVVGALDYFLRSQQPLVRWLFSAVVVAAAAAAVWRWGWPALRTQWSRVATARRIEDQFPSLKNRLSNSVAFAGNPEHDPTAGSLELRRAVIAETDALAMRLDFTQALDRRPLRRARLLAGAAVAAVVIVGVLFPISSAIALRRLANPWADANWPLRHSLAFVDSPTKLAAGADFEAQVIDRNGRLPDNVRLLLRFGGDDGRRQETIEMKPLGKRMVYRLENVTQPFAYRAVGGDDHSMPWTEVEVIEPPRLVEFSLRVQPPDYTGWPEEQAERVARVLAGSQLSLTGELDKPATSVRLRSDGQSGLRLEAKLSADGRSFRIPAAADQPWTAEKSGAFTFELLDEDGIAGGGETRLELQVVADAPPAIAWETPTDQTFVTPRAVVPLKALVKDDLAVERVVLKYLRPDATDSGEQAIELHLAPPRDAARAAGKEQGSVRRSDGESLTIDAAWDLAKLGLQPGNVLAVRLEATDFKPQSATTSVRRISVIDEAEFENRLLQQQTSVFTQLSEALRLQREAHGQITALQVQLEETKRLQPRDIDQLQAAELMQRQAQRLLSDPSDGVDARLTSLLTELSNNGIDSENIARRMTDLQARVRQISRTWMTEVAQQLTSALKSARTIDSAGATPLRAADWTVIDEPLSVAEGRQQQVIDELEALLGELNEWDNFSRLAREVGQVREQQEKTQQETESLRWKIAAAAGEQPTPEQRAAARQLATRQQDLARRYDKLQGRMDELHTRLEAADPQTAQTLAEASELGRRLAIGGQMRQAGRELTEHRVGAGQQTQQKALESLGKLLDALASRRDRELERTVESLRAAREQLDLLRTRQRQLATQAAEAASEPDEEERKRQLMRLAKEERELAKEAEEQRRKLERLQAKRPAQSTAEGQQRMSRAGDAAAAGDAGQAQQEAEAASRLLDEARQRLQQEIEQAQADLVREKLTRLEQAVEGLALRQKNVVAEIARLEAARTAGGDLPSPQQATLRDIAAEQQLLAEEAGQLRAKIAEAAAFALALEGGEREMQRSARLLGRGLTDRATTEAAAGSLKRLEQMLNALKADDSAAPPAGDDQEQEGDGGEPSGGESLVRSLAELRLLAELQEEINRRTAEIEQERQKSGDLTGEQQEELAALAAEQGKLAEMIAELAAQANPPQQDAADLPPIDDQKPDPDAKPPAPDKQPSLDEQLLRDLLEMP